MCAAKKGTLIYSEMQEKDFSPRTVRYAHAVFSMALSKAVEWGNIAKNPCDYDELPKQTKKETKAFSPDQAKHFLECATTDSARSYF